MPDDPYVHAAGASRPVWPGGTRARVFRRRPQGEEGLGEREGEEGGRSGEDSWRALLEEAVEELNASFRAAGTGFHCVLEEDDEGFCLHIRKEGQNGTSVDVEEEILEPGDLPEWLRRIRSCLGLLVDETV